MLDKLPNYVYYFILGVLGIVLPLFSLVIVLGFGGYNNPKNATILMYVNYIGMPLCAVLAGYSGTLIDEAITKKRTVLSIIIAILLGFFLAL
jgi:hypothetical protein